MAMYARMPGQFPTDTDIAEEEIYSDESFARSPDSQPQCTTDLQWINGSDPSLLQHSQFPNELFLEAYVPKYQDLAIDEEDESSTESYLVFEPVLSSVSDADPTDWKRYDPPPEISDPLHVMPRELRDIVMQSTERIRTRHVDEDEQRKTTARREKQLRRAGRASAKPKFQVPSIEGLTPATCIPGGKPNRLSNKSIISASDSGYSSDNAKKPLLKVPFKIKTIFQRRDRPANHLDPLLGSSIVSLDVPELTPGTTDVSSISISETTECVSCLEDFLSEKMINLSCHSYCSECFLRLIMNAMESETHWPVKCCLNPIPRTQIVSHVDAVTKKRFKKREVEWSIPSGDRIYCSKAGCNSWIPPKRIDRKTSTAKCSRCANKVCMVCRGEAHGMRECPQDTGMQATVRLAEVEGWKRCYSCKSLVEHNNGCRHMTCRCKAEFCYVCSARWRTCTCTDADLALVQQRVVERRQEARALTDHQAAEERENQIILRMVADFERAEAERLAAEAEADRRRAEALRHREEERVAVINEKFRIWAFLLDELRDIQRDRISERYCRENEAHKEEFRVALNRLRMSHEVARQLFGVESAKRMSDFVFKFDQECQTRSIEERRKEEQYVQELKNWLQGQADANIRLREKTDDLQREQAVAYQKWDLYRKLEIQKKREKEEQKLQALARKQVSETREIEGRLKIDEVEWKRKKVAESRWVDEVIREQAVVLEEVKLAEYARDI